MKGNLISSLVAILFFVTSFNLFSQQVLTPEQIYEKVNDAVVIVLAYDVNGKLINQGSGVVVDDEGYIITNYHVMKNASKVNIVHSELVFENAELIGGDEESDILFIKIPKSDLAVIETPESDDVKIGQKVYAIGSPMGYENTISDGIVSGYRKFDKINLIQITASISPGSSGGAVVNSKGELVGISTYTITEGQNINFAIPIKDIRKIEAKPYVYNVIKPVEPIVKQEETEKQIKTVPKYSRTYNPRAFEYLIKGKELIRKAYSQETKKNELNFYKKAIIELDNAIKLDSSLVEGYYEAGRVYASRFDLNDFKRAIKYFDKIELYVDRNIEDVCDSISNREMISNIAMYYSFQEDNFEENSIKAIQLYNKALDENLPEDVPSYSELSNDQIYYKIARIYQELGNNTFKGSRDYFKASEFFDLALEAANKMLYKYEWLIETIKKDDKVDYQLYIESDWQPFRILCKGLFKEVNVLKDCNPLVGKDILYMYHPNSLIKEKNSIVRVWVKEINLNGISEHEANGYDYLKSLFEFDLKNKKFRILQQSTQYSNELITTDNFPNAEWQFVSPETISETMVENLKIITK